MCVCACVCAACYTVMLVMSRATHFMMSRATLRDEQGNTIHLGKSALQKQHKNQTSSVLKSVQPSSGCFRLKVQVFLYLSQPSHTAAVLGLKSRGFGLHIGINPTAQTQKLRHTCKNCPLTHAPSAGHISAGKHTRIHTLQHICTCTYM